ncbi:MAG: ATP-binding protein [Planctomycetota bacterium]
MDRIRNLDLENLPEFETTELEYKSSRMETRELRREISRSASAFWNSGGGLLLIGVDNDGHVDGGIPDCVGRQPVREWLELALQGVQPTAEYAIRLFGADTTAKLSSNKIVAALEFGRSHLVPHMADDGRFYVRAGASSKPATQFLVEALWAQRASSGPDLRHVIRLKPGNEDCVQLGVVATTSQPALDVEVTLFPLDTQFWAQNAGYLPVQLTLVARDQPFFMDLTVAHAPEQAVPPGMRVLIRYHDRAGKRYHYDKELNVARNLGPVRFLGGSLKAVERELEKVTRALGDLVRAAKRSDG